MTIDKQKLLQWIESKKYVYGPPYDTVLSMTKCKAALNVLNMLEHQIELGEFAPAAIQECPICEHDVNECFCRKEE